ncbi:MAG: hypothetical protein ACR2L2_19825 [Acidobacteriota bacterium]
MTEPDPGANSNGPVAWSCDLSALDEAQRKRRALLDEWLQVGTCEIIERPDGYAFWLHPDCLIAQHVDEFIALEQLCCPFVRFRVLTDTEHEGPVLEIGGGEGVKEFVHAHFGIRDHAE